MPNFKEYPRDKVDSSIGKITVDRDLCIGAATCVTVAANTFKLDGEQKAVVTDPLAADDQTLIAAAQSCPTQAISLFDKQGNKIFPK